MAGHLYERIRIKNYNPVPVSVDVELSFGADFADIFEVRGMTREVRGTHEPPRVEGRQVTFGYHGRDGVRRQTRIELGREPSAYRVRGDLVEITVTVRLKPVPRRSSR